MLISISGGKGGTGKSTVAVNLAALLAKNHKLVLADLDVENPNDHVLLNTKLKEEKPVNIMLPFIEYSKCIKCGVCGKVCDTGAMLITPQGLPYIIPRLCSGCRACYFACPTKAILEGKRTIGYTYETPVKIGETSFTLVTGMLREGEEHTPPVVLAAKKRALGIKGEVHLIDTSAGTSNSVAIAVEGSEILIAVTEPTPLGFHDLELILKLAKVFNIRTWIVVNRADLGPNERILKMAEEYEAEVIAQIPFSKKIVESYVKGIPIVIYDKNSKEAEVFEKIFKHVEEVIENH